MRHGRTYLAVAALSLVASVASAEDVRRVGVVVTTVVNMTDDEADAVAEQLGDALRAELGVDVIAGRESRRRLPEAGLPDECVAKPECRHDVGQRLDAAELLLLVVVRIGDRVQIDATWANVATGAVTSRPAVVLEAGADRAAAFAAAAPKLLPHLVRETKTGPDVVVVPVPPGTDDGRHMTTGSWIATGVAGAALIGGTVFALSARSKHDALGSDGCREMSCPQDRVDAMERHALYADLLYGAAIGAGVTAVVLYWRSDAGQEPPPVSVGAGPGELGLSIGGRF